MNFLQGGDLLPGICDVMITLLPKVEHPEFISQFRPRSLCNVTCKFISKVLENRMRLVLPDLIGLTQSSFIMGRQLHDNVVILQEVIHSMRRRANNNNWMVLKIYIQKAYDRLRWSFVENSLQLAGFSNKWCSLIMMCLRGVFSGESKRVRSAFIWLTGIKFPFLLIVGDLGFGGVGRSIQLFWAKLAWRLLHENSGLWAKVLRRWQMCIHAIPDAIRDASVAQMWDGRTWKWHLIRPFLDESVYMKLEAISLSNDAHQMNQMAWSVTSLGNFLVKSAYFLSCFNEYPQVDKVWKVLWGAKVSQRIRFFLWLVVHEKLMSNYERARRGFIDDPGCSICGAPAKMISHVLRDCPATMDVWNKVWDFIYVLKFQCWNLRQWFLKVKELCSSFDMEGSSLQLLCITLCWVWKWPNKVNFQSFEG
ncbi:hypothetical protein GH714_029880 [Hevea brasiliensis]|uniref:Reverse transcriptase zinc-binding domain-containing protein n=1 Tax=Hevea brasiliensis TaxID=3981 RepID=A0A6A6LK99_HEVBR|nr:hypothetical protein GH714_029880 [Hevea brasiliensis]